jgi:hypothetical protein
MNKKLSLWIVEEYFPKCKLREFQETWYEYHINMAIISTAIVGVTRQ